MAASKKKLLQHFLLPHSTSIFPLSVPIFIHQSVSNNRSKKGWYLWRLLSFMFMDLRIGAKMKPSHAKDGKILELFLEVYLKQVMYWYHMYLASSDLYNSLTFYQNQKPNKSKVDFLENVSIHNKNDDKQN